MNRCRPFLQPQTGLPSSLRVAHYLYRFVLDIFYINRTAKMEGLHFPDVEQLAWGMIAAAVATFFTLMFGPTAPYGRQAIFIDLIHLLPMGFASLGHLWQ